MIRGRRLDLEDVEAGAADAILNAPQHPYTKALMTAAFDLAAPPA